MSNRSRIALAFTMFALMVYATLYIYAQQGPPSQQMDGTPGTQGPPPGGPISPAKELERLSAALNLSDQQKAAILPILEQRHTAMEQLMHSSSDRASVSQQIHNLMGQSNQQIRALLTEEQAKKFYAMRPPRPQQGGMQNDSPQTGSGQQGSQQGPPPDGSGPPN